MRGVMDKSINPEKLYGEIMKYPKKLIALHLTAIALAYELDVVKKMKQAPKEYGAKNATNNRKANNP